MIDHRLRPASAEEAGAVAAIWFAGWREAHAAHVPDALLALRTQESFGIRAGHRIADTVVAVVGQEIAGFAMILDDEVDQVYVAPGHRGTGVAESLLDDAARRITAAGHRRAWLAVIAVNARARRFYERCGWIDEGPFDYQAATERGPVTVPCHRYARALTADRDTTLR